jgi:hypothetical protein
MSTPIIADSPSLTDAHRESRADDAVPAVPSFARRRLRLGISGVGLSVVSSLAWLALLLTGVVAPARLSSVLDTVPDPVATVVQAVAAVCAVFVVHAAFTFVLEFRGGAVVVRQRPTTGAWLRTWARGVFVQGALLLAVVSIAASGGALLGTLGVIGGAVVGSVLLLALQGPIARLLTTLPSAPLDPSLHELARSQGIRPDVVRVIDAPDEAFVGGWVGIRPVELWIPRSWTHEAQREVLTVQFARRQAQFASGARRRGIWRAAMWPAFGLALLLPLLPWTPADVAYWLALPAVSTLWMFVGVLLLPSLSRPIVYNADSIAAARLGRDTVARAVRQLDAWQDDEAERSPGVEFIFHPVPSRGNRERALQRTPQRTLGGAHQLTRLSLFSALAAGSLLGRVVHCNIGRPSLWAVYPGD